MSSPLSAPSRAFFRQLRPASAWLLCLGLPCFLALAFLVTTQGHANGLDALAAEWSIRMRSQGLTRVLLVITHLHSVMAITAYAVGLSVFLIVVPRHRHWLLPLWLIVPGGALLNAVMKQAFARPRPVVDEPLLTLATFSFPSGHASGTTLLYGFLALVALVHLPRSPWRWVVGTMALLAIALVSWSRVYLGVHFFTDVLAGVAEAWVWLALCVILLSARTRPGD
ncbi:phosphatase PAP2 family protein [Aquabacterium sp.]|uniref:phosphatase PAP2 family protein n=1 Tax=Aquabacterium sp. TaxID=1872578 RepID=UPI003D6C854D